jgi:hypothetical protein
MKPTKWELTRRNFLRSLGLGAAVLPLLSETRAAAQATAGNTRLIVIVKPNGVHPGTFWPTWAQARPADGSLATAAFPHVTEPLAPYRDKLLFPDGLTQRNWLKSEGNTTGDNGDAHHNWGSLLTGELPSDRLLTDGGCRSGESPAGCRMLGGSVSLDCFIGQQLKLQQASLTFDSLHVSLNADDKATARRGGGYNCPSWFARDQPNAPEPDPAVVYSRLFGNREAQAENPADPSAALRDRLRLFDFVGRDIERFRQRLGSEDQKLLEAHLESVRRRQQELSRLVENPVLCVTPGAPTAQYIVKQEQEIPAISRVMMDLTVDAMKCGLTRTACYSLYDSNAYHAFFSWLNAINPNFENAGGPPVGGYPLAHFHAMAHGHTSEPATTMYRDANRWLVEQFAYLLGRLTSEAELDGNMLDNTLVLYVDSLANGAGHTVTRLPWILAGNANGYFRSGRHVALPSDTAPNGLFVSIAEAMGVPPPGGVFGNPQFGSGSLGALA